MEGSLFVQQAIDRLCAFTAVDNAQSLFLSADPLCHSLPGQLSFPPEGDTLEYLLMEHLSRTQLDRRPVRQKFPEYSVQRRLSRGTQHSGSAVILDQLGNGTDAGTEIRDGQHLCLVKNNDALGLPPPALSLCPP